MKSIKQKLIMVIFPWILTLASIFLIFKTSSDPVLSIFANTPVQKLFSEFTTGNAIIFNLSIGFLVSVIFYLLVVWFPNMQKKRIIKHNLKEQYRFLEKTCA
jgi:hypothetical protein